MTGNPNVDSEPIVAKAEEFNPYLDPRSWQSVRLFLKSSVLEPPHPPHPQVSVSNPPSFVRVGDTIACGRGGGSTGRVPIRTRGQTLWYYSRYICTLCLHLRLCKETRLWRQVGDRVNFLAPYRWRQHFLSYSFLNTSRFRLNPASCAIKKQGRDHYRTNQKNFWSGSGINCHI